MLKETITASGDELFGHQIISPHFLSWRNKQREELAIASIGCGVVSFPQEVFGVQKLLRRKIDFVGYDRSERDLASNESAKFIYEYDGARPDIRTRFEKRDLRQPLDRSFDVLVFRHPAVNVSVLEWDYHGAPRDWEQIIDNSVAALHLDGLIIGTSYNEDEMYPLEYGLRNLGVDIILRQVKDPTSYCVDNVLILGIR